jgi:hypothetical protein
MVLALLAGTKTQTRRILKHERAQSADAFAFDEERGEWEMGESHSGSMASLGFLKCPYGQPGDRLWVRETWGLARGGRYSHGTNDYDDVEFWETTGIPKSKAAARGYSPTYRADWTDLEDTHFKPSIHMPRWMSRISLEVTSVRVERLQAITEADACLWDEINDDRATWKSNPWVWVLSFRRLP